MTCGPTSISTPRAMSTVNEVTTVRAKVSFRDRLRSGRIAIFLGVVIGTYSSIYISAPVLVWLGVQPDSFLRAGEAEEADAPQTA